MADPKTVFSLIDYLVFFGMLLLSVVIGVYFGCRKKRSTPDEYLLGGKSMSVLPVGLSLVATQVSGLTLLAVPSDVYLFGANYFWICVTLVPICLLTNYVYLPVLIKLKEPSVFEYLHLRFGRYHRMFASFLFVLQMLVYIPVVAFIPAIALSQGIYVHYLTPIIGVICLFYTTIGGFKAVIWTDALQFIGILGSVIAVFCLGVSSVGGFDVVWERALEGQRLDIFDCTLDPTVRDGVWPIFLGGTIYWTANVCLLPGSVQKFLSVSTLSKARRVTFMLCCGLISFKVFSVLTGIIIYAKYYCCDPISKGDVTRNDQILPYFFIDVAGHIPGLPGVFIAGIFSAALSTMSSSFNAIAATMYTDFIAPHISTETSEKWVKFILPAIVVACGTICIIMTLFIEHMGTLLAFAISSIGLINGFFLGMFTLGMLFPNSNSRGVAWATAISFIFTTSMAILNQWYKYEGVVETFARPMSVECCTPPGNVTLSRVLLDDEQPFILFRLSIWYNPIVSFFLMVIVGVAVSWLTKKDREIVNPDLISPVIKYSAEAEAIELITCTS